METIILVVHLLIGLSLVGVVLLQRSEGGLGGLAAVAVAAAVEEAWAVCSAIVRPQTC